MNFKRFLYFFIFQIFITTFVVSARALEEVKSTDVAVQTQIQNPKPKYIYLVVVPVVGASGVVVGYFCCKKFCREGKKYSLKDLRRKLPYLKFVKKRELAGHLWGECKAKVADGCSSVFLVTKDGLSKLVFWKQSVKA